VAAVIEQTNGAAPVNRKKRVLSAAARAKISNASKAHWAKFRAEKGKKEKG